jgi:hypothetical protein
VTTFIITWGLQLPVTTLPGTGRGRAYILGETDCTITCSDGARERERESTGRKCLGLVVLDNHRMSGM